jgi:hypothetical protein
VPTGARVLAQDGVVSRSQALEAGWSSRWVAYRLDAGRWQRLLPGVYAMFSGPVPARARAWAALLYAGPQAVLAGRVALWLRGTRHLPGSDRGRRPATSARAPQQGLRIRVRAGLGEVAHPVAPATAAGRGRAPRRRDRLDAVDQVVTLLLRAVHTRATTPSRLGERLACRARHRWRAVVTELLDDARAGALSALERRYLRTVHRRHGLPAATLNAQEAYRSSGTVVHRYRDIRHVAADVVVELDGRDAHPAAEAFRDRRRDNALVATLCADPSGRQDRGRSIPTRAASPRRWPRCCGAKAGRAGHVPAVRAAQSATSRAQRDREDYCRGTVHKSSGS